MLVGRLLLHRMPVGNRFAPAGQALLRHARRMLRLHDEAWAELSEPDVSGTVRFGLPGDYAEEALLPPLLGKLRRALPARDDRDRVRKSTPELRARMARGDLDVALFTEALDALSGPEVRREDLLWVATGRGAAPWAIEPLPLALSHPDAPDRAAALAALLESGRSWRIVHESGSAAALIAVVRAGLAVAVFSRCAVPPDLRILGRDDGMPELAPLAIVLRAPLSSPSPAAIKLAAHIRAVLPDINGRRDRPAVATS